MLIVGSSFLLPVSATVVRFDIESGGQPSGSIYIELFNSEGPSGIVSAQGTVDNFLNYIDDNYLNGGGGNRRYDGTLVHRKDSGFVIQGGGFIYDPTQGDFSGTSVTPIIIDDLINNEFNSTRSNLRGTIAMARMDDGDPSTIADINSATSQWFINLKDNSELLDNSNGGFTVFGQVLGDGMAVADAIDALDIVNFGRPFNTLPVVNSAAAVNATTVITLARVEIDPPAAISSDATNYDAGLVATNGASVTRTVTIQNIGGQDLALGIIGGANGLTTPFSFSAKGDNCSGQTLRSTETCTIDVVFAPIVVGAFQDSFDVSPGDANQPGLAVSISGTGTSLTPALYVTPSDLDFGNVGNGQPAEFVVTVRNLGDGQLQPLASSFSGPDSGAFSISGAGNTCNGATLAIGQSCSIPVRVLSFSLGGLSAALDVTADDGSGVQATQVALSVNITRLEPAIQLPPNLSMPDVRFDGSSVEATLSIVNGGVDDLYISAIDMQGADAALFTVTSTNCIGVAVVPQSSCNEQVTFSPVGGGTFNAVVRVQSNDPDSPVANCLVTATASQDGDGVSDAIEQAAPNNGDGNLDGIADALQENVTSLPDANGQYVTFATTADLLLADVESILEPPPTEPLRVNGGTLDFQQGFFFFMIDNVPLGGEAIVTLYLPPGGSANSYFKFGRLPGEPAFVVPPHWYDFTFDPEGQTGAEFSPGIITLHFIDGGRGDNDQTPNGQIVDPGGPAFLFIDEGSSGGGCVISRPRYSFGRSTIGLDFLLLFAGLILMRVYRIRCAAGTRSGDT